MSMDETIKDLVRKDLEPEVLELVNESARHSGHAGDDGSGETHYNLLVVSPHFENLSRVERQRLVNQAISSCFQKGLHALSMRCLTPQEYKKL
jgi:BolA protein